MLVTTDPFRLLTRLEEELQSIMPSALRSSQVQSFKPLVEVRSDGDDALISLELPGVDPEKDLSIEVEPGRLTVAGERHASSEESNRSEFYYGSFRREFALPERITPEDVKASYDRGVLTLRVANVNTPAKPAVKIPVGSNPKELSANENG